MPRNTKRVWKYQSSGSDQVSRPSGVLSLLGSGIAHNARMPHGEIVSKGVKLTVWPDRKSAVLRSSPEPPIRRPRRSTNSSEHSPREAAEHACSTKCKHMSAIEDIQCIKTISPQQALAALLPHWHQRRLRRRTTGSSSCGQGRGFAVRPSPCHGVDARNKITETLSNMPFPCSTKEVLVVAN